VVESLFSSIRHRVVNDFSLVHALLGMAMRKTTDAQAVNLFRASRSRIRVIALFHAMAWHGTDEGPSAEEAFAFIKEIAHEAERARALGGRVRVELETDGVPIGFDQLVAVGLCVSELVQNALDHAFPAGRAGLVRVALVSGEGRDVVLRVSDDGVGISPEAGHDTPGLGLSLVRLLAEQLMGKHELRSGAEGGTDFCLRFASTQESNGWPTS
jgi:two-component sensor histidine kinase